MNFSFEGNLGQAMGRITNSEYSVLLPKINSSEVYFFKVNKIQISSAINVRKTARENPFPKGGFYVHANKGRIY